MRVLVYGTGGVGGYFGGRLAKAGHSVTFIARGEHLASMKQNGLHVKSTLGDFHIEEVTATDNPATVSETDLVILGVKSWQVKDAMHSIRHLISGDTLILPLQNGVTINREIEEVTGQGNVLGGLCKIISKVESPGVINHMMFDPIIIAGELDNRSTERLENLKSEFNKAGIAMNIAQDIQSELWKKFMFICSGGLGALTRVSYGVMRQEENVRHLFVKLIAEIYEVGLKSGVQLEPQTKDEALAIIDSLPYEATSSMQRDIIEGRPSEIDYWNGAVAKLGKELAVQVPVNTFIYECLKPQEVIARSK